MSDDIEYPSGSDRFPGLKRERDSDDSIQVTVSRPRTDSDLTFTTTETSPPSGSTVEISSNSLRSVGSENSLVTANEVSVALDSVSTEAAESSLTSNTQQPEWNNFEFSLESIQDPDVYFPSRPASSELKNSIYDGPFRADYLGQTIIVNHETSPISLEEFKDHILRLCEFNSIFQTASYQKGDHYFIGSELNIIVDVDNDGLTLPPSTSSTESSSSSSSSAAAVAATSETSLQSKNIPLHPTFALAREILIYAVAKSKLEVLKDALAAGMNFHFKILLKPSGLVMNLLQLTTRIAHIGSPEIVEFLITKAGFNPSLPDSFGFTPLQHVAYNDNRSKAGVLLLAGADPNFIANGIAPIHLAAAVRAYRFLKPFIHVKNVDINILDPEERHLIHYALNHKSFSFFNDLLKHPRILLDCKVVVRAFKMIEETIPAEDERFYDVLIDHVITRKTAHITQLHYIIFGLLFRESIKALHIFSGKGFDFTFVHESHNERPSWTPLTISINHDRLESYKFLVASGITWTESLSELKKVNHVLLFAIQEEAIRITQHLLDTTEIPEALLDECLQIIVKKDLAVVLKIFLDKFGDGILQKIGEITPEMNENIYTLLAIL